MSELKTDTAARCDEAVAKHYLLDHSFYQRWSNGTLPVDALRDYAREYGAFISRIGRGWEAIGRTDIARVEDGHAKVWDQTFASSLGTAVNDKAGSPVDDLLKAADELFSRPSTAIGALYAIEAQQPRVADEKIRGLEQHYTDLPSNCAEYFRLHLDDYAELSVLEDRMTSLEEGEKNEAVVACERMSKALFDALSTIESLYPAAVPC